MMDKKAIREAFDRLDFEVIDNIGENLRQLYEDVFAELEDIQDLIDTFDKEEGERMRVRLQFATRHLRNVITHIDDALVEMKRSELMDILGDVEAMISKDD